MVGWLDGLASRALRRTRHGDTGDVVARVGIVVSSMEDELLKRDLPPPPVAGWRYEQGSWRRWSELDGAYRPAPVPMSLFTFTNAIGAPREGLTVALVDGEWQEVASGSAPLHDPKDLPNGADGVRLPGHSSPAQVAQPAPAADVVPAAADPAEARARAEATTKAQIEAWRRRNQT